jgi:hypothetical protein
MPSPIPRRASTATTVPKRKYSTIAAYTVIALTGLIPPLTRDNHHAYYRNYSEYIPEEEGAVHFSYVMKKNERHNKGRQNKNCKKNYPKFSLLIKGHILILQTNKLT